ncbi:hypothetical protein JG687_00003460 [Phytophthora cactorum]|uniref:Uncharacterized protein n=1 Tax=Phytophthora cactorum TaxID=29920 RepID=A0A8T1UTZ8_9STRA|nr:hypothetical protein JG687_00003460 [Phytophthora cactorum]
MQQVSVLPSEVWEQVREQFYLTEMTTQTKRDQVTSRVYRIGSAHFDSLVHGHVEVPPLSQARDGSNFL